TARHDSFTGGAGWNPVYGWGKVDALAGVKAALAAPRVPTATPTPLPPAVDFSVNQVRVQSKNTSNAGAVGSVKAGSTVYLFIYWTLKSIPAGVKPSYSYTASVNGKVVKQDGFGGSKASYPPD